MNFFISFADSRMKDSLDRLERQAEELHFFDTIRMFTEQDLPPSFVRRMGNCLSPDCKGFGYWGWKPCIIYETLEKMKEGDRLLYLDAGCHINIKGRQRFLEYVDMLDRDPHGMLVFSNGCTECKWTKGDVFRHFGVSLNDERIALSQQIAAGHVFIRKTPEVESIINEWLQIFYDHRHLIDNSPSSSPNHPDFIENRYDQSIFSLLCKLHGISTLPNEETFNEDWQKLSEFPFQDRRDIKKIKRNRFKWLRSLCPIGKKSSS